MTDFVAPLQPIGLQQYYLNGLAGGLWYSLSILAILGAHEFGHYYACRYYGIDASLPYFLPVPLLLTGIALTCGACACLPCSGSTFWPRSMRTVRGGRACSTT